MPTVEQNEKRITLLEHQIETLEKRLAKLEHDSMYLDRKGGTFDF